MIMRKPYAISFAAFYLLLTTGMYVCMLHCAGEYLLQPKISKAESHHEEKSDGHESKSHTHEKEPCSKDKDCKCCDEHGRYAISENIQTAESPFFSAPAVLIASLSFDELFTPENEVRLINRPKGKAPPGSIKTPLYISNRTLLI